MSARCSAFNSVHWSSIWLTLVAGGFVASILELTDPAGKSIADLRDPLHGASAHGRQTADSYDVAFTQPRHSQYPGGAAPAEVHLALAGLNIGSRRRRQTRRLEQSEAARCREIELTKIQAEIESLIVRYHAQLPSSRATAIGAIYARYSSKDQHSIADQVRSLLEKAASMRVFVPRENIYFDAGITGRKDNRPGFQGLQAAARKSQFQVVYTLSTSRLARKVYIALKVVEEEFVEKGIRFIALSQQIDTDDNSAWRMLLAIHGSMDESFASANNEHIRAAHISRLEQCLVMGTLSLGYTGVQVDGRVTKSGRPPRQIVKDPIYGPIIKLIFKWYVHDRMGITAIVHRLNSAKDYPLPPRSSTWAYRVVRGILTNTRYRGYWCYGVSKNEWSSSKDTSSKKRRESPLRTAQHEELRLVSDVDWYAAQRLLAGPVATRGRKPKGGDTSKLPRLLTLFFYCPTHDQRLHASGHNGLSLTCPKCRLLPTKDRPLRTYLNRQLANRLTCQHLAQLLQADTELVQMIIRQCQLAAEDQQRPDSSCRDSLRQQLVALDSKLNFLKRNVGDSPEEQEATQKIINEARVQRSQLTNELAMFEAVSRTPIQVPIEDEVKVELGELGEILLAASTGSTEDQRLAREIVEILTGGRIEMFQMGERKRGRGWLQGRFQVHLAGSIARRMAGPLIAEDAQQGQEVVIDYHEPERILNDALRAVELYEQNVRCEDIASQMEISASWLCKLLKMGYEHLGRPKPDHYTRRPYLKRAPDQLPLYQRLADEVHQLEQEGVLLGEIAERLGCSRVTVGNARKFWYERHGFKGPPDARGRANTARKSEAW